MRSELAKYFSSLLSSDVASYLDRTFVHRIANPKRQKKNLGISFLEDGLRVYVTEETAIVRQASYLNLVELLV